MKVVIVICSIIGILGLAGAIISGGSGTAEAKIKAMQAAGIHVSENLGALGELCAEVFR